MTLPDPYSVPPRKKLSDKQRLQLFLDCKGVCCLCGGKIGSKAWDDVTSIDDLPSLIDEHMKPLWLDGSNDKINRGVAHVDCAQVKSNNEATERARGRSAAERHFGAKRPKTKPMLGSRRSGFKRKMSGELVRR